MVCQGSGTGTILANRKEESCRLFRGMPKQRLSDIPRFDVSFGLALVSRLNRYVDGIWTNRRPGLAEVIQRNQRVTRPISEEVTRLRHRVPPAAVWPCLDFS